MKDFKSGVGYYTQGFLRVYFPEGDEVCKCCPGLENDYKLERCKCRFTGEIIPAAGIMRGQFCPVQIEKEEE